MERINYTLYINLVKKTLWILSIVLIILIFFNKSLKIYLELDLKEEFNEIGSNQIIENPQFLSTDKKNRPFVLKAKKAKRKESTKNIFILDSPSGNLENNNGFITLKSMNGKFDQDKEMLFLFNDVRFENEIGYKFSTEDAYINLNSNEVFGDKKIRGFNDEGEINSEGFKIIDQGNKIIFFGKARLVIKDKKVE